MARPFVAPLAVITASMLVIAAPTFAEEPPATDRELEALGAKFIANGYESSFSPDGKRLVYAALRGLPAQVHKVGLVLHLQTGKSSQILTDVGQLAWQPGLGEYIAYTKKDDEKTFIWLCKPDGSDPRKIVEGNSPAWSKVGRTLFYHSMADNVSFRAVAIEEGQPTDEFVVVKKYDTTMPAVNPKGSQVAWTRNGILKIVDTLTKEQRNWTIPDYRAYGVLSWSSSGKLLAITPVPAEGDAKSWLFNLQTGEAAPLPFALTGAPTWSPDDSRMTFNPRRIGQISTIWMLEMDELQKKLNWNKDQIVSAKVDPAEETARSADPGPSPFAPGTAPGALVPVFPTPAYRVLPIPDRAE